MEPTKPISRKSRRPAPVESVLIVQYGGLKATQFFSNYSPLGVSRLKKDLELLKFPLPKYDNVSFVSHGVMKAVWVDPNDQVRRNLEASVYKETDNSQSFSRYTAGDLARLSIKGFSLNQAEAGTGSEHGPTTATNIEIPYTLRPRNSASSSSKQRPRRPRVTPRAPPAQGQSQSEIPIPAHHLGHHSLWQQPPQDVQTDGQPLLPHWQKLYSQIGSMPATSSSLPVQVGQQVQQAGAPIIQQVLQQPRSQTQAQSQWRQEQIVSSAASSPSQPIQSSPSDLKRSASKIRAPDSGPHKRVRMEPVELDFANHRVVSGEPHVGMASSSSSSAPILPATRVNTSDPSAATMSISPLPGTKRTRRPEGDGGSVPDTERTPRLNPQAVVQHDDPDQSSPIKQPKLDVGVANSGIVVVSADTSVLQAQPQANLAPRKQSINRNQPVYTDVNGSMLAEPSTSKPAENHTASESLSLPVLARSHSPQPQLIKARQGQGVQQHVNGRNPGGKQSQVEKIQTYIQELCLKVGEGKENLDHARKTAEALEKTLRSERAKREQMEEEIKEEIKTRERVEEDLRRERNIRAQSGERLLDTLEKKEAYHRELQVKMEDERTKREELERRLEAENELRAGLEEELKRERSQRMDAEATLEDVKRECQSPFIVPVLLEAFAVISNLTTRAMEVDDDILEACQ